MPLSDLARRLTQQQVEDFRAAFEALDKNKDGVLTAEELGAVMRELKLDPTTEELADIINEVDTDSNGTVDFEEFLNLMAARATQTDSEKELRDAFAVFDRDGSGTIEADEIRKVMKSLGDQLTDEEIEDMIKHVDKDGNGTIDYEEFAAFMRANEED